LARIEAQAEALEEIDIADVDAEDPAFESLLVGRKVKVLLQDVDRIRWRQDLIEDRNRLATLLSAAKQVSARETPSSRPCARSLNRNAPRHSIPATASCSSSPPSPIPPSTFTRSWPSGH
jgi:hypothetical protein